MVSFIDKKDLIKKINSLFYEAFLYQCFVEYYAAPV